MFSEKIILSVCILFASAVIFAQQPAPQRVRTGTIVKEEFTQTKPGATGKSPVSSKSSAAWGIVTIRLDAGRAASIFDYALRKNGTEYPCIDMASGSDQFAGMTHCQKDLDNAKEYRFAFAVPSTEGEYEFIFKLIEGQEGPVKLNQPVPKQEPGAVPQDKGKNTVKSFTASLKEKVTNAVKGKK